MKYFYKIFILCLYGSCLNQASGQVHENAIPFSATESLPAITHFEDMPSVDSTFCSEVRSTRGTTGHFRFACPVYTDFDPENSGEWTETSSGMIWRMSIRSGNAYSLYLNMRYRLLPGVKLFVYGPGYKDIQGGFTHRNNNSADVLSIAPVRGDKLTIELNLPASQYSYGELKITKVYHDYRNIFGGPTVHDQKPLRVNNCGQDINCSNGKYWQTEKRSVCKIISNGKIGTGTLIGNTSYNSTPYILTAHHLISSPEAAAEALFVFNYETTGCQGELTTVFKSLSGASLLSTTDQRLDFILMMLNEKPPQEYQPFYAGWDARNRIPQMGASIHHPYGGSKQIAIEYHPLVNEDIGEGFDENSTLKVSHWEVGTTEQGSSGAPLFNEQRRVVGTLTGGRSSCHYPKEDYFTKFSASWDNYANPTMQLKNWLDSAQTGQLVLNGYDPYGFNAEFCDTAWNFAAHDKLELSNRWIDWGWISGHSSAGYTHFAERFEPAGALQMNGVYLNVAKAYSSNPLANVELKIWEGDQYPGEERYSKLMFIDDLQQGKVNYVPLDTVLKMTGPFFIGYKINYGTVSDTFALYHAKDRGHTNASSMYLYKGSWSRSEDPDALGISTSLGVGISACYGVSKRPTPHILNVYPNPGKNSVTLHIPDGKPIHQLKCYDNNGRPVPVSLFQNESGNKLSFELPPGMYHIRIMAGGKYFSSRFIVLK